MNTSIALLQDAIEILMGGNSLQETIEGLAAESNFTVEDIQEDLLELAGKILEDSEGANYDPEGIEGNGEPMGTTYSENPSMDSYEYFDGVAEAYGWVTLEKAADDLGVSEEQASKLAKEYSAYVGPVEGSNSTFDDEEWEMLENDEVVVVI